MSAPAAAPSRTPIADCLERIGSHEIVDMGWCAVELRGAGYVGPFPRGWSHDETWRMIEARGLGGELAPELYPGQQLTAGYALAMVVCLETAGQDAGQQFHGRGSAYRARLAAVRAWELAQAEGD